MHLLKTKGPAIEPLPIRNARLAPIEEGQWEVVDSLFNFMGSHVFGEKGVDPNHMDAAAYAVTTQLLDIRK
jgi:hypothetical protein